MPTFDFACADCGYVFEFTRPFGSKEHPSCPKCGSKKTEKQIAPPTVHFKGSGFYVTDSSSSKQPSKKEAEPKKEEKKKDPAPKKPEKDSSKS